MSKADYEKLMLKAKVKIEELKNQRLEREHEQERYRNKLKRQQEKDAYKRGIQTKIMQLKEQILEVQKLANSAEAEIEASRCLQEMARNGKDRLERVKKKSESDGSDTMLMDTIKASNEFTWNWAKANKEIERRYDHKIVKVRLGNFELLDGGEHYHYIHLSLEKHWSGSVENVCTVYKSRKSTEAFKNKIGNLETKIQEKESLLETHQLNETKAKENVKRLNKDVEAIQQLISKLERDIK